MKKKLAMRIVSLALCVVFTGMLFGAPKSKAVATEVAVGTAAVASYFQATGLTMAASAGSTGALVTSGIADFAGSYAMATGAATSGSAWLSSLAAGVSISPAGALVLTAAAVVAIGAFVAWYVNENSLDAPGDTTVAVQGTADSYLFNGIELPSFPSFDAALYLYAVVYSASRNSAAPTYYFCVSNAIPYYKSTSLICSNFCYWTYTSGGVWEFKSSNTNDMTFNLTNGSGWVRDVLWANFPFENLAGESVYSEPTAIGDVTDQLEVVRSPEFTQPDVDLSLESQKQMVIDLGYPAGTTLETVVAEVPDLIAAGNLAPTYEITDTQTGDNTDTETQPDVETGIYIPVLSEIKTLLGGLADAVVNGIKGLFIPSDAAIDGLSDEVDAKLPFIPGLKDFGADLAYNLEHPEECVDEIGFTTIVDLGKGRGTYLGNSQIDLLDVSWYLEYKPFVDDVIVGFVWLVFLWNLYGELPRIIHGEGSFAKMYGIIEASRKENDL